MSDISNNSIPVSWTSILPQTALSLHKEIELRVADARAKGPVAPAPANLFAALHRTPPGLVKAVIIGQDPYHTPGLAQGLSFSIPSSVPLGTRLFPSSLRNINKALQVEGFGSLKNGDLSHWADQGVLLLNATLTVGEGKANSHADFGWQEFTDALIQALSQHQKSLSWMLWGSFAQKKAALIDPEGQHLVLTASHPSGLSAYKTFEPFLIPGDVGSCRHFTRTNDWLKNLGKTPISWCL